MGRGGDPDSQGERQAEAFLSSRQDCMWKGHEKPRLGPGDGAHHEGRTVMERTRPCPETCRTVTRPAPDHC